MCEEILKAVRADSLLALLLDLIVVNGQKLRRDGAVKHIKKRILQRPILSRIGNIAYVGTDLGFCQTEVDVVHARMITVVGTPAVNVLAEILGADIQTVGLVGDVHQNLRAFAGLGVFIGDRIIILCVPDILKMLQNRLADIDDAHFSAELPGHNDSVVFGAGGRSETGHRTGNHVFRRKAKLFHGHGTDQNGEG